MSDFKFDLRQFDEAIFYRMETTDKALPEIINTAAKNVAYRAAQFTPFASKASIRQSLMKRPNLLAALTSRYLRATGQGKLAPPQFKAAMEAYVNARSASSKYLRAGWAPCVRALGHNFKGGVNQKMEDEYTKLTGKPTKIRSTASPAKRFRLAAILTWITLQPTAAKQASAERIAFAALQKGIDFVATDMIKHAQEKLAKLYL